LDYLSCNTEQYALVGTGKLNMSMAVFSKVCLWMLPSTTTAIQQIHAKAKI